LIGCLSYYIVCLLYLSLGMKDSWGPLKALAAASVINGVGDIFLCSVCDYGIAGAAWATMVSQVQTHLALS
jgi:Na+-driven multidrug efflux pump